MTRELIQSQACSAMIYFASAGEHITGVTGLTTMNASASKNGAAFFFPPFTATAERGRGWYNFTVCAAMVDTLGDFVMSISAASSDPVDLKFNVVYPRVAASAATWGNLDVATSSRLAGTATGIGYLDIPVSSRLAGTATGLGSLGNLDVLVSSRLAGTATGTANVTQINGQATDGYNATLKLKQLDIENSDGNAFIAASTGNNGTGAWIEGHGTGPALEIRGDAPSVAALSINTQTSGDGVKIAPNAGHGIYIAGYGADKHGILASGGTGAGKAISAPDSDIGVNVIQVSGDATAADNAKTFFDGTGAGKWSNLDTAISVVSACAKDCKDFLGGTFTVDPAASAASAFRMDGTTLLKAWTLSAASYASAVPAFIKRTV